MKKFQSLLFRVILITALTFVWMAGSVNAVYAGNGADTWKNVTDTFEAYGSCSDPDGIYQITVVSSGAVHRLATEDGFKFSWAEHGTYVLEPVDADSPVTYSGRYSVTAENHFGSPTFILHFTSTSTALGSDGSRGVMHATFHLTITPNGIERSVDHIKWNCH